jgi:hypothetical protein
MLKECLPLTFMDMKLKELLVAKHYKGLSFNTIMTIYMAYFRPPLSLACPLYFYGEYVGDVAFFLRWI